MKKKMKKNVLLEIGQGITLLMATAGMFSVNEFLGGHLLVNMLMIMCWCIAGLTLAYGGKVNAEEK